MDTSKQPSRPAQLTERWPDPFNFPLIYLPAHPPSRALLTLLAVALALSARGAIGLQRRQPLQAANRVLIRVIIRVTALYQRPRPQPWTPAPIRPGFARPGGPMSPALSYALAAVLLWL